MKWSVIGLFGLGFLAAVCAVVLVIGLREDARPAPGATGAAPAPEARLKVLVAAGDFAPRKVIRAEDLAEVDVAESAFPAGAFSEAVQVVGRVLVTPMAKDQAFLPTSFADGGSSIQLASTLTDGLRAYVLALDDDLTTEPLLYPGSFVDVIAAVDVTRTDGSSTADRVGFTLIQGAMVLAVRGRTIVAPSGASDLSTRESTAPRSRKSVVTLLVTPTDAMRLRLAEDKASISLAIRNPVDVGEAETESTRLSELFPVTAHVEPAAPAAEPRDEKVAALLEALERARQDLTGAKSDLAEQSAALDAARAALHEPDDAGPSTWETVVLRGGESSLKTFKVEVPQQ